MGKLFDAKKIDPRAAELEQAAASGAVVADWMRRYHDSVSTWGSRVSIGAVCSNCNKYSKKRYNTCPNCKALMRGADAGDVLVVS